ncbi:MAG: hypothetical protein ABI696_14100 [Rubrivivax sp.]
MAIRDPWRRGTRRSALMGVALLGSILGAACAEAPIAIATTSTSTTTTASTDAPPLDVELIRPGLYRIEGAGGSTLLRTGPDGVVLVDSKRAGAFGPLMAEIRRIAKTADPQVRAVFLTAAGPEQAGNVASFSGAGIPVIVQKRVADRLKDDAQARGAPPPGSLVTFDHDHLLYMAGYQVEAEHVGRGRTGSDSVVLFRDLRVLAVGGLYTAGTPAPDCASGGSFAGWAAAIAHLSWFDFDVAVPSRGAPVSKAELTAFKARLEALAARGAAGAAGSSGCPQPR